MIGYFPCFHQADGDDGRSARGREQPAIARAR